MRISQNDITRSRGGDEEFQIIPKFPTKLLFFHNAPSPDKVTSKVVDPETVSEKDREVNQTAVVSVTLMKHRTFLAVQGAPGEAPPLTSSSSPQWALWVEYTSLKRIFDAGYDTKRGKALRKNPYICAFSWDDGEYTNLDEGSNQRDLKTSGQCAVFGSTHIDSLPTRLKIKNGRMLIETRFWFKFPEDWQ